MVSPQKPHNKMSKNWLQRLHNIGPVGSRWNIERLPIVTLTATVMSETKEGTKDTTSKDVYLTNSQRNKRFRILITWFTIYTRGKLWKWKWKLMLHEWMKHKHIRTWVIKNSHKQCYAGENCPNLKYWKQCSYHQNFLAT